MDQPKGSPKLVYPWTELIAACAIFVYASVRNFRREVINIAAIRLDRHSTVSDINL